MNSHFVSVNVAAAILGISEKHVRKLVKSQVLPATYTSGYKPTARSRIDLLDIGVFRGAEVTFAELGEAMARTQRQRDRWTEYQRARRDKDKSGALRA
jgi:hypothetical protein